MTLKHVLKLFSKTEVQEHKTHPCHLSQTILNRLFGRVLEKEGVKVSCAEHIVKDFSSFTSHFSQLCTPHPSPLPQGAREQLSCAEHTEKNLFSYLPIHLFTFKKAAFTLAEVLITLGIIGVVAALTLPTLIANHQKQTLVNQLKKAVNTLENAAQSATADEGVSSFNDTLFKCFFSDGYLCGTTMKDEYKEAGNKYLKTISLALSHAYNDPVYYKTINGNEYPVYHEHKTILNDGVIIYTGDNFSFFVDVNGEKGPNVLGRDLFELAIDAYGHVIDAYDVSRDSINYYFRGNKTIISSHKCEKDNINPLETKQCFYYKIVSDGWKMNY